MPKKARTDLIATRICSPQLNFEKLATADKPNVRLSLIRWSDVSLGENEVYDSVDDTTSITRSKSSPGTARDQSTT